jgi:hypothetical protein
MTFPVQMIGDLEGNLSPSYAPCFGYKNQLMNGSFNVRERFVESTNTGSTIFHLDRWFSFVQGSADTQITVSLGATLPTGLSVTRFEANVQALGTSDAVSRVCQVIEGATNLRGKKMTLSGWFHRVSGSDLDISFRLCNAANLSQGNAVKITLPSADAWHKVSVQIDVPNVAFTNLAFFIYFSTGTASAGDPLSDNLGRALRNTYFWGLQLEEGVSATPLEMRPLSLEKEMCKRYYEKFDPQVAFRYFGVATGTGTTSALCFLQYSEKRASPAFTISNVTNFQLRGDGASVDLTSASFGGGTTTAVALTCNTASGLVGGVCYLLRTGSTGPFGSIEISSELTA